MANICLAPVSRLPTPDSLGGHAGDRLIVGPERHETNFPERRLPGDVQGAGELAAVDLDRFAPVDEHHPLGGRPGRITMRGMMRLIFPPVPGRRTQLKCRDQHHAPPTS